MYVMIPEMFIRVRYVHYIQIMYKRKGYLKKIKKNFENIDKK